MNIYFPKNHTNVEGHPSLGVQFHIQSIQNAVRLRLDLRLLNKKSEINKVA